MSEELDLKWGTLKGWNLNEGSPAHVLMEQYLNEGSSMSAMLQHDTENQKRLILEIIDAVDTDQIYLDWDGKYISKDEAKEYVLGYGKNF
jgi:hypothetical protein